MKKITTLTLIAAALLFTACGESASNPSSNGNTQTENSSNENTSNENRPNGAADTFGSSKDAAALDREVNGKCGISKCGAASHPITEDN